MRSVADALREDTRRRVAALTPEARIRLAFELGEADMAALREARQISAVEARAVIATSRRHGRRPSRSNDD